MALGWLDRFRLSLARGLIKAAGLPIVPPWITASFLEPTHQRLVQDGYKANGAVFACISALTFAFPEPPLVVWDENGDPIADHPLRQRLRRPNPLMGEAELMIYTIAYMAIGGNAYWHKVRSRAGQVVELWPYHAGQITPVPGGDAWIERFDYDPGWTGKKIPVPVDDVVHFKWPAPDPDQPWMAMPPLKPVARETDSDNELTRYLFALLKNDAMPRTALVLPAGVTLDDTQYNRLKTQWNERYGGENRGGFGVVEGGADVKRIGLDLKELAFEALHGVPEARIAGAFRVPPIVAGLNVGLNRSTFANYAEARQAFTEQTLVPLWAMVASEVEANLLPEYGDPSSTVAYDLGDVQALTENENEKWTRVQQAVAGGYLTVNEARHELGFEEMPDGDVFLRGLNIVTEPAKTKAFGFLGLASKARGSARRRAAAQVGQALQRVRKSVAGKMEKAVDGYFSDLAERVVERAKKSLDGRVMTKAAKHGRAAVLEFKVSESDLLRPEDDDELKDIVRRFYAEVLSSSWETWNLALGVDVDFDLDDPAVTAVLRTAGTRIRQISDTTRDAVRELLQYGSEQGWSVDQLVRGDEEHPGLRDIVEQTYKNRARTIARTELGEAQQKATVGRYGDAGVKRVLVLDGGSEDSDEVCNQLNGTTQTLEWAERNSLQHPQCVRVFGPVFD